MAACSANLDTIIATHSRLGGAPVRDLGHLLPVSGTLIANGWLSWSSLDGAGSGEREVVPLPRPRSRRPSSAARTTTVAAAA